MFLKSVKKISSWNCSKFHIFIYYVLIFFTQKLKIILLQRKISISNIVNYFNNLTKNKFIIQHLKKLALTCFVDIYKLIFAIERERKKYFSS